MNTKLKMRDIVTLSIILVAIFIQACHIIAPFDTSGLEEGCSQDDANKFVGCFGDQRGGEYIIFDSEETSGNEAGNCDTFQITGSLSGVLREEGTVYAFDGSLTDSNTLEINIVDEGTITLTRDDANNSTPLEYQTEDMTASESLDRCTVHCTEELFDSSLVTACFRNDSGEHWLTLELDTSTCNGIIGQGQGLWADGAGVDWTVDNGRLTDHDIADLTLSNPEIPLPRTVTVSRAGASVPLSITGTGVVQTTLPQVDSSLCEPPNCSRLEAEKFLGCFGDRFADHIDIWLTNPLPPVAEDRCYNYRMRGEGSGIYELLGDEWSFGEGHLVNANSVRGPLSNGSEGELERVSTSVGLSIRVDGATVATLPACSRTISLDDCPFELHLLFGCFKSNSDENDTILLHRSRDCANTDLSQANITGTGIGGISYLGVEWENWQFVGYMDGNNQAQIFITPPAGSGLTTQIQATVLRTGVSEQLQISFVSPPAGLTFVSIPYFRTGSSTCEP